MDWALGVFAVVAGMTVATLRWWSSHEGTKVERGIDPPRLTTAAAGSTPRDDKHGAI